MAQKLFNDKIGTATHSTGVISLAASKLTIGGQQYITTSSVSRTITNDVTLAANTLYMVYAVISGGAVALRISTNVNSVGPAGFSSWKLVGAFDTDGTAAVVSPLIKAFIDGELAVRSVKFEVWASGSQSIAHQASEGSEVKWTTWAAPNTDSHNGWDSTNSRYVFPQTGTYLFTAKTIKAASTAGGPALMLKPFLNNTVWDARFARWDNPVATIGDTTLTGTRIINVTKGDYLDIRIFQNSGGALTFTETTLTITQIPDVL